MDVIRKICLLIIAISLSSVFYIAYNYIKFMRGFGRLWYLEYRKMDKGNDAVLCFHRNFWYDHFFHTGYNVEKTKRTYHKS
jgi:hypothetical protein